MSTLLVFIPILSFLARIPSGNISFVNDLLRAISAVSKENDLRLEDREILLTQLSLQSLVCPVSLEPRHTFGERVAQSATAKGCVDEALEDQVKSEWSDPEKVHLLIYIDRGPLMRAAENLHCKMWGQNVDTMLSDVLDHDHLPWKCVRQERLDWLGLAMFGYTEKGLLIRTEYKEALDELCLKQAKHDRCRGAIVIGQPGIGKTSFLYYLLLYLLGKKIPVAFQLTGYIIVFQDGNVFRHPLSAEPFILPHGTWALTDSNDRAKQPCDTFLDAAERRIAWIVQATSPLEERYKNWQKVHQAQTFVMDCFSLNEMTALGMLFDMDPAKLQHAYENWGPSARTCVLLAGDPDSEHAYESSVKSSAILFIRNPRAFSPLSYDPITVPHRLFSLHPEKKSEEGSKKGRQVLIADVATDRIKAIISYAAADAEAEERVKFYYMISKEPTFSTGQGKMFERFVLTWLSSFNMAPLSCTPRHANGRQPELKIPSCGCDDAHKICGSLNDLHNTSVNALPFCFLPSSASFATADAIVITKQFIITIQVTIARSHDAKGKGFVDIKASLPTIPSTPEKRGTKKSKPKPKSRTWCHVFITDDSDKAGRLRNQNLPELPIETYVYSAVFDVGQFKLDSDRMRRLDDARQRAEDNQPRTDENMVIG